MNTPTQRLYWEDARRKTALANVTARYAGGFLLDKTVFHVADKRYHHAQPCDKGYLVAEGHKLKIDRVTLDKGLLVHRTSGPVPAAGAKAQLHLDWDRRWLQARAHTMTHLLIAALVEARAEILAQPEVAGGGEVRCVAKFREAPEKAWPKVVSRVRQLVDARLPVEASWSPRDEAEKRVTPQAIALRAIAPEEPTLRLVKIGPTSVLPCDAPLVDHSWQVETFCEFPPLPAKEGGTRLRLKAVG